MISPSTFNGVKASLSSLRDKDTEVVRKMLINVALSDGKIDPDEVRNIEKLYTTLGLDKSKVPGDIHAVSSAGGIKSINSSQGRKSKAGNVELNEEKLKKHETATNDAKEILNKIFQDDEPEEEIITDVSDAEQNDAAELYKQIISSKLTSLEDFEKLCSEKGLFMQSAIDSINEWSFEMVDAPVIEIEDEIVIDEEIAEELEEFI